MLFLNSIIQSSYIDCDSADKQELKILIIDDDDNLREFLKMVIEELYTGRGVEVVSVESGEKGLEYIENFGYRLILLDLLMPSMNGAEVLEEIRKKAKDYYVVIMTAYAASPLLEKVIKTSNGFLEKPFGIKQLREHIDKFLKEPCEYA